MPWCPKCKNEYVKGITVCADCGCELVDSLEDIGQNPVCEGPLEEMEQLAAFLTSNHFQGVSVRPGGQEGVYEVHVSEGDRKKLSDTAAVFYREMEKRRFMEETAEQETGEEAQEALEGAREPAGVYEDSGKKAEEFKSGAYTLLGVGVLGLAVLVLLILGVLPIRLNPTSQWMTCLVMGALFILFIVMGVQSMQSAKRLSEKGEKEASMKEKLEQYCRDNLQAAPIDEAAGVLDSDADEMRYFKRTERMKIQLADAFPDLDGGYLDHFVDEIYPQLFEE